MAEEWRLRFATATKKAAEAASLGDAKRQRRQADGVAVLLP
jgi:hypothetical protein